MRARGVTAIRFVPDLPFTGSRDMQHRRIPVAAQSPSGPARPDAVGSDKERTAAAAPEDFESALRASEASYANVAAHVPGMVYQFAYRPDGTSGYTFVSEGARRLFGVEPAEALRDASVLVDLIHPDEREDFIALARGVAEVAGGFRWEGRVLLPTGEERIVEIAAQDQRLPDGTVISDGLVIDVTELRLAARRRVIWEQQFQSLFNHNPDGVFSMDLEGRLLMVNPACETLAGRSQSELLNAPFEPLIAPAYLETTWAHFRLAVSGAASRYETAVVRPTGEQVQLAVTNVPILVEGRVTGVFGIAKDLSTTRGLEQQLRQAQKMEAVGRLAGGIAHDFNNLLTVVTGYTDIALRGLAADAPIRRDLGAVLRAARQAAQLTRQLLAFSRRQVLKAERLDANHVVTEAVSMLRRLIGEDIAVQTELGAAVWPVHADPGQLQQVLLNLAVNARDAMPQGGVLRLRTANFNVEKPDVNAMPGLVPGEYVSLVVEDTGTGINPAVLPHIFEPFYTTKEVGHGTGLGLATVYGIVKQSGGYVYVESEPGAGSRFTVLLPRTSMRPESMRTTPPKPLACGRETILLVEDEPEVRAAVSRMLRSLGYTILEAESGAEALRVAEAAANRQAEIGLLLSDVVMPGQNGRLLGDQLRERWPELPVLYMSGYTDDEILRRGLEGGGVGFLEKPFSTDGLSAAVRKAIDQASA